jgi:hypothetical protein
LAEKRTTEAEAWSADEAKLDCCINLYRKTKLDKEELSLLTVRNISLGTSSKLLALSYSLVVVELSWSQGKPCPSTSPKNFHGTTTAVS